MVRENAPDLAEHLHHLGDKLLGGGLEAELLVDADGSALAAGVAKLGRLGLNSCCALTALKCAATDTGVVCFSWNQRLEMVAPLIPTFPRPRPVVAQAPRLTSREDS